MTDAEWSNITQVAKSFLLSDDKLCGDNECDSPLINDKTIHFNGIGENGYEDCWINKQHSRNFNFCKTANKYYDKYVVALLCIINHFAPNALDISSDGRISEWEEGLKLANTFVPNIKLPFSIRED